MIDIDSNSIIIFKDYITKLTCNLLFDIKFDNNNNLWGLNSQVEKPLFVKTAKDEWLINTDGVQAILISYLYYANELNAGSTFLNENQLYVNPINCCLYDKENIDNECNVFLEIPADYTVATSLQKTSKIII